MMNLKIKWYGDQAIQAIGEDIWTRLVRATEYFLQELKVVLNVRNPPPFTTPSLQGEPPRKRTGWLQSHVVREYDREQYRSRVGLGANAFYGLILETVGKRPWFLVTLRRLMPTIQRLIGSSPTTTGGGGGSNP